MPSPTTFSQLIQAWRNGDEAAGDQLVQLVYRDLHRLAQRYLQHEQHPQSLQPTALISELFVRLLESKELEMQDRTHFFALAAQVMRRILIDRARSGRAEKRPPAHARLPLEEAAQVAFWGREVDLLALDEALERLEKIFPRAAQVVVLCYFAGFTQHDAALLMGISLVTVKREWDFARTWLYDQLGGESFRQERQSPNRLNQARELSE